MDRIRFDWIVWQTLRLSILLLTAGSAAVGAQPKIAIIIDDLGYGLYAGRTALALPGAVTYSILPHTPFAGLLAEEAHTLGKEVMLHLPMESVDKTTPPGPGVLTLEMNETALVQTLASNLASVPHATGVNNHMGSLLTSHPQAMQWLMTELRGRGLYFVDSRTTKSTVAEHTASCSAVPNTRRDLFLDNDRRPEAVRTQFHRLLDLARDQGEALAIGHPHPETLGILIEELQRLPQIGVELVQVSELTKIQLWREQWHASLSH